VLNQNDPNELGGLDNIFGVRVGLTTKFPVGTAVALDTKIAVLAWVRFGDGNPQYSIHRLGVLPQRVAVPRESERGDRGGVPAAICVVDGLGPTLGS
jgi:hypothetical protein